MAKNKDKGIKVENGKFISQLMKIQPEELYAKYGKGNKGLKAGSKAETKAVRAACVHHYISKKGKRRSLIDFQGDRVYCRACKHYWSGQLLSQDEIDNICDKYIEILNAGKYFTTAMDFGENAQRFFITGSLMSYNTAKVFGRLTELVSKDGAKKRGGKKNKKNKTDMGAIPGTWRVSR